MSDNTRLARISPASDSQGRIHIAAESVDGDGIYYITNSGGSWTTQRMTTAPPGGADLEPSIAIDSDESAWILFSRWTRRHPSCDLRGGPFVGFEGCWQDLEGIYLTNNAGGGWSAPLALPAQVSEGLFTGVMPEGLGELIQLQVHDGQVHLAYLRVNEGEARAIRYVTNARGFWTFEQVSEGQYPSLALDSGGAPHIAFLGRHPDGNYGVIFYASRPSAGGPFEIEPAFDEGDPHIVINLKLGLDGRDTPHIMLAPVTIPGGIYVVSRTDGGWSPAERISLPPAPEVDYDTGWVDAEFDPAGTAHVLYREAYGLDEWYVTSGPPAVAARLLGFELHVEPNGLRLVVSPAGVPSALYFMGPSIMSELLWYTTALHPEP